MTAQRQADLDALREWDGEEHVVVSEWTRPDSDGWIQSALDALTAAEDANDHTHEPCPTCMAKAVLSERQASLGVQSVMPSQGYIDLKNRIYERAKGGR